MRLFGAVTALLAATGAIFAARRILVLVNVTGVSMEPTLRDGDRILVRRHGPTGLRRGRVVVLPAPEAARGPLWQCPGWHVKRVVALPGDPLPAEVPATDDSGLVPRDSVVVFGDNPFGGDSRNWGPYGTDGFVGTLVCRTRASGQAG
ncbi:S26 family signal peptidase [Nocardia pseudobrasiliensis]|uniref:Signal peptidase I n=1 Tax=Nocardia pseudobrasiliensis TaxID=45979 RepID=A0A370IEX7_9NOCA|nr:S26 family signal peptidase [Nocardia pseudobrasiliensis]RDI69253.1 signal peptidase I [Nocardia pseudobrasiliensis]